VLQSKRNRDVAEEAVRQFQKHLEQAKGFYEVGTKPKFDVTKAEVDLSNAKLGLIKSGSSLKIAMVTLNNAMGVPDAPEYTIEDNLSFQKYEIKFENAVETAYKNRPEMRSITAKKISAEQAVELAKKGYYPVLSGNAAYSRLGERFPLGEGWNVGVALSFPVFSGFWTKSQIENQGQTLIL
jgi:outer membrane protein TolC